jgi:FkbM family methyltransferase
MTTVRRSLGYSLLNRLRYTQPFNWLATSATRAILLATGLHSELVIKHLHRVGNVACRLPNGRQVKLWSHADDWVSNQIFWRGWQGYEPETVPLFFRLAARSEVTIDVGAYVGFFTLLAAHANLAGRVFAFEPLPSVYRRLQSNVALNLVPNVECVAAAVGAQEGTAEFYHVDVELPTSSSLSYDFMSWDKSLEPNLQRTPVPVVKLDDFVIARKLKRVDLLKIDTESTEPDVLRGALTLLRQYHPTIICEVLRGRGSESDLEELLRPLGYRFYLLTPQGPEPRERIEGHPEWLNYLFTTLDPAAASRL